MSIFKKHPTIKLALIIHSTLWTPGSWAVLDAQNLPMWNLALKDSFQACSLNIKHY